MFAQVVQLWGGANVRVQIISGAIHDACIIICNNVGIVHLLFVQVRIYMLGDQVLITFKTDKDLVEEKIDRIQRYILTRLLPLF